METIANLLRYEILWLTYVSENYILIFLTPELQSLTADNIA